MENTVSSAYRQDQTPDTSERDPLEDTVTYSIDGRAFIVEPRYKKSGQETLCMILLKLMKSDVTTSGKP